MNNTTENITEKNVGLFLGKVYAMMTGGFILTAISAYLTTLIFGSSLDKVSPNFIKVALLMFVIQLGLVVWLGKQFKKSTVFSTILFLVFSLTEGFTLSIMLMTYEISSIGLAFMATAVSFGVMSFIGLKTKKNIDGWGTPLFGMLVGIIIVSVASILFGHTRPMEIFLSILTIVVFTFLTIYDNKKLKDAYLNDEDHLSEGSLVVFGALTLYLDFLNLFLNILRLFGVRKN